MVLVSGWSLDGSLVSGAALRTVAVWHITWSVNSVSHVWGYRNYETPDVSRNNALIALVTGGEGWHNNHHADSRSARHGHKWWEIDQTWLLIRVLMLLGLARNVAVPSPATLAAKFSASGRRTSPSERTGSPGNATASPFGSSTRCRTPVSRARRAGAAIRTR